MKDRSAAAPARDADVARGPARPRRARIGTAALFMANGVGIGAWAGALPLLQQQSGLSDEMLSMILVCFAAGAVAAMAFAGRPTGRYGSDRTALAAAIGFAAALCLPPTAPSVPALAAAALLLGATSGLLDVAMNTQATIVEEAWGSPIMSSFHALFSLGGMFGSLALSLLLRSGLTLAGGMLVAAAAAACLALLAAASGLRRGLASDEPRQDGASPARRPGRAVLVVGALAFLAMMIEGAMSDWSGVFLKEVTGVPAATAATAYGAFAVAMVAGRLLGDGVVRRLGAARVLLVGAVLVSVSVAGAVAAPSPRLARICFAAAGIGLSNLVPVLFSAGAGLTPERPQDGVAGAATGGYAGFLIGPAIIGFAADGIGLRRAFAIVAVAAAILGAAAPRLARRPPEVGADRKTPPR